MAKKGNIEKLGKEAQEKVIKWNLEGVTQQEIADRLNSDFNSNLNRENVMEFLSRFKDKSMKLLKDDDKLQKQLMSKYFDTITQLNKINEEMWNIFYSIKKDPDFKTKTIGCPHCHKTFAISIKSYGDLLKSADMILNQIRHVDVVLGKMNKKPLNITYNILDLSKKLSMVMPELLDGLENRGIVKINKKRLKQVYN